MSFFPLFFGLFSLLSTMKFNAGDVIQQILLYIGHLLPDRDLRRLLWGRRYDRIISVFNQFGGVNHPTNNGMFRNISETGN